MSSRETAGGQSPAQAPHSGPRYVKQRDASISTTPRRQIPPLEGKSAPRGQAAAHGNPSHISHARTSGRITGVPASGPASGTYAKIAPCGHAARQSPQPSQRARKSASVTAPGGRRRGLGGGSGATTSASTSASTVAGTIR